MSYTPTNLNVRTLRFCPCLRLTWVLAVQLKARQPKSRPASHRYTFHRLIVTNDDKMLVSSNPRHVCRPKIHPSFKPTFDLPVTSSIKLMKFQSSSSIHAYSFDPGLFVLSDKKNAFLSLRIHLMLLASTLKKCNVLGML